MHTSASSLTCAGLRCVMPWGAVHLHAVSDLGLSQPFRGSLRILCRAPILSIDTQGSVPGCWAGNLGGGHVWHCSGPNFICLGLHHEQAHITQKLFTCLDGTL